MLFRSFGPLSGRLSDRYGTLPFTTAGLLTVSSSLLLSSTLGPDTPYFMIALYLAVGGAGMGLFVSPNMSSIMGSVPPQRRGIASGVRATFFNVGYTLSFNIVILVLAFYIPYSLVTSIISSSGSVPPEADKILFSAGLDNVFRLLAAINLVAVVPSVLRGRRVTPGSIDSDSNMASEGDISVD